MQNLSAKDHKDAKAWILERHLQAAKQYQDVWTDKGLEHIYQESHSQSKNLAGRNDRLPRVYSRILYRESEK